MTIPSVVAGHTTRQDASATTSRTITTPTHLSGDTILIVLTMSSSTSAAATITDFNVLYDAAVLSGGAIFAFYKKAGGSEPASYTISTNSVVISAIAVAIRNFGGIHAQGTNATGSSSTATAPAITTRRADCLRISLIATDDSPGITTVATLSGHSLLATVTGSGKPTISFQHKNLASATTDGSATAALSGTETWTGITFAVAETAEARTTKVGSYLEVLDNQVDVTKVGAYLEILLNQVRATKVGLYVEITEDPPEVVYRLFPSEQFTRLSFNGIDLSAYLRTGALIGPVMVLDTTNLSDSDPNSLPGEPVWSIELEGMLSLEIDDALGLDALRNGRTGSTYFRDLEITFGEVGNGTTYSWVATSVTGGFVGSYKLGPNTQFQEVPFTCTLLTSGAPTREEI